MSLTGAPVGQPLGAATSLVDRYTSLHATIGTLARHCTTATRPAKGQLVDCCLMDSALTMVEIPTSYYLADRPGGRRKRPAALQGQGRLCRDLRLGQCDGDAG